MKWLWLYSWNFLFKCTISINSIYAYLYFYRYLQSSYVQSPSIPSERIYRTCGHFSFCKSLRVNESHSIFSWQLCPLSASLLNFVFLLRSPNYALLKFCAKLTLDFSTLQNWNQEQGCPYSFYLLFSLYWIINVQSLLYLILKITENIYWDPLMWLSRHYYYLLHRI